MPDTPSYLLSTIATEIVACSFLVDREEDFPKVQAYLRGEGEDGVLESIQFATMPVVSCTGPVPVGLSRQESSPYTMNEIDPYADSSLDVPTRLARLRRADSTGSQSPAPGLIVYTDENDNKVYATFERHVQGNRYIIIDDGERKEVGREKFRMATPEETEEQPDNLGEDNVSSTQLPTTSGFEVGVETFTGASSGSVVFDFDGVVHTNVTLPDQNGQVHPVPGSSAIQNLQDHFNPHFKTLFDFWNQSGYKAYILSSNNEVSLKRTDLRNALSKNNIHITEECIKTTYASGKKSSMLIQNRPDSIPDVKVFYDDSIIVMNDLRRAVTSQIIQDLTIVHYYAPPKDKKQWTAMTYNVSWESTKPDRMSNSFGTLGMSSRNNVEMVRDNILDTIYACDPDFVALQEVPPEFFEYIRSRSLLYTKYHTSWLWEPGRLGREGQLTCWRKGMQELGKPSQIFKGIMENKFRGRPYTVVNFGTTLTLINVHAAHGYDADKHFRNALDRANSENVIMLGDFNRELETVVHNRISLHNNWPANQREPTCCSIDMPWSNAYGGGVVDHIFVTNGLKAEGQPSRYIHAPFPSSDHQPVLAQIAIPETFMREARTGKKR